MLNTKHSNQGRGGLRSKLVGLLVSLLLLPSAASAGQKLEVAATEVPQAEILEFVKPTLKEEGIDLKIDVFNDYIQPNLVLVDKQVDANFFQHKPYLESFNRDHGTNLVAVANVHIEPFGAYSKKIKHLSALPQGAVVAIPYDPTNGGRALLLLQKQGLIRLAQPNNIRATPLDIKENPKDLKFQELEAATLPHVLDDVDLALINANYALEAGLSPRDALFEEGVESPYVNVLVTRADNQDAPAVQKLVKALQTDQVRKFILEKYKGVIVPAF